MWVNELSTEFVHEAAYRNEKIHTIERLISLVIFLVNYSGPRDTH